MMGTTELLLVRHGETAWNAAGRYQGHFDAPLSPNGATQAAVLAPLLAPLAARAPVVFSSDLARARVTAAIACPWAYVQSDARLRELAFGEFEGLTHDECMRLFGERYAAWIDNPLMIAPSGGETMPQLQCRITDWLRALPMGGCAIAFTHGGVVRALISRARGSEFDPCIPVPPASAVWIRVHDGRAMKGGVQWLT